jgi:hypothetical protein
MTTENLIIQEAHMKQLIDKSLEAINPFDIATILYKLNSDKYSFKKEWSYNDASNYPDNIVLNNLKKEISTTIRKLFIEYNSLLLPNSIQKNNCEILISYCFTNPKFKNDVIREAKELFYKP